MKKQLINLSKIAIILITIALTSCEKGILGIKGEGEIVTKEYDMSELNGIALSGEGNIHITPSDTQRVIIKAQQNILDNLKLPIHNNILSVEFDKNVKSHDGFDVYISVKTIETAQLSGSGSISTTGKFTQIPGLNVAMSGSGTVNIDCDAEEINCQLSGSGSMTINTDTEFLSTDISGSGDYILSGKAIESYHSISGSGNIKAYALETNKTSFDISGSANAEVWAIETLDIKVSGSADIYYKGNPVLKQNISGSGNLIHVD